SPEIGSLVQLLRSWPDLNRTSGKTITTRLPHCPSAPYGPLALFRRPASPRLPASAIPLSRRPSPPHLIGLVPCWSPIPQRRETTAATPPAIIPAIWCRTRGNRRTRR